MLIFNPILRTQAGIRRHLLRAMPIGTSFDEVIYHIEEYNSDWVIRSRARTMGVVLHPSLGIPMRSMPADRFPTVGEQSIQVHLGAYRIITRIYVTAWFAFDENGSLIEVFVRREFDLI